MKIILPAFFGYKKYNLLNTKKAPDCFGAFLLSYNYAFDFTVFAAILFFSLDSFQTTNKELAMNIDE